MEVSSFQDVVNNFYFLLDKMVNCLGGFVDMATGFAYSGCHGDNEVVVGYEE